MRLWYTVMLVCLSFELSARQDAVTKQLFCNFHISISTTNISLKLSIKLAWVLTKTILLVLYYKTTFQKIIAVFPKTCTTLVKTQLQIKVNRNIETFLIVIIILNVTNLPIWQRLIVKVSMGNSNVAKLFKAKLMLAKLVLLQLTDIPWSDSISHVQGWNSNFSLGHLYNGPGGIYSPCNKWQKVSSNTTVKNCSRVGLVMFWYLQ